MDIDIQKGVESQGKGAVVGQQFPQSRGQAVVQAVGVVFHIGGPPFGVAWRNLKAFINCRPPSD